MFKNRDIFYHPVRDEATFNRLLAMAPQSDAAVLTLLKSEWKPARKPPPNYDPAVLYVLAKLDVLQLDDDSIRKETTTAIVQGGGIIVRGPDAQRLAAQIDRETYLRETINSIGWRQSAPFRLTVLREVTGQDFGFDKDTWQDWLRRRPVTDK